jgi:hypothetical protein
MGLPDTQDNTVNKKNVKGGKSLKSTKRSDEHNMKF